MAEDSFVPEPVDPLATVPVRNNKVVGDSLHKVGTEEYEKSIVKQKEFDARYGGMVPVAIQGVATQFQYGGNTAVNLYKDLRRVYDSGPEDPNWYMQRDKWIADNKKTIPADQLWRYERTGNQEEATNMLRDATLSTKEQELLARGGFANNLIAGGIAGVFDLDAPLMLFSGGLSGTAKAGINATRAGRIFTGAAGGFATGVGLGAVEEQVNPTADWTTVPVMGLGGLVLGGIGGAISSGPDSVTRTLNEFGEAVAEDSPILKRDIRDGINTHDDIYRSEAVRAEEEAIAAMPPEKPAGEGSASEATSGQPRAPRALTPSQIDEAAGLPEAGTLGSEISGEGASIGARQLGQNGPGINSVKSTRIKDIIKNATSQNLADRIDDAYYNLSAGIAGAVPDAVLKGASRFRDAVVATGFATDFDRLYRSGSEVAKRLAVDTMEHASGIIRNNRSASALREHYLKQLQGAFTPYNDAFDTWAKAKGSNILERNFDFKLRDEYDQAVLHELNTRWHDAPNPSRQVDPDIKIAADAIDEAFRRELAVNKGRPGEGTTRGYDTITEKDGYFPQKWSGAKINKMIAAGRTERDIVKATAEFYKRLHPGMSGEEARIYAQAAIDRARRNEDGISSSILQDMADADSRRAVEDLFRRNGVSQQELDTLIDRLTGNAATRGQASHTKERIKIDMRDTSSNGIRAMDLFDTDINKIVSSRMRRGAGSAALARKGILSRADRDDIINAILEEQAANGANVRPSGSLKERADNIIDSDKHLTREELLGIFSYFEGGPINGGISPAYSRIMKLTRLSTLNGLGLTQMAETATTIASVGVSRFIQHAGKEISDALKKVDSPLVQELKHMDILVPEEKLFRDDLPFEFEKQSITGEWMGRLDQLANKAQRVQGYTSGFYQVRNIQQRIATTAGVDKIVNGIRKGDLSPERAYDMGLDVNQMQAIDKYIRNKTIEFKDGSVHKLNLNKWDPVDAENFSLNINRVVNQDIQKAMIGENAMIFHKDGLSQLFFQLKSFPMLAMEKQAYRHLKIMDQQAAMTFLYGLGTAAAVYMAKQTIAGRTDKLDAGSIANGAFAMSNLTGWIPMWVDPVAGMLGMDDMKFNQYGRYGATSVVSVPASFNVMDRMAQIPGRAATLIPRMVAGDGMSYDDVQALKAMPIIGNAYGFSALFNAMQ